jgi:predicted HicB family RNase H-like nuclease
MAKQIKRFQIRMTPELFSKLQEEAALRSISIAKLITQALTEWLQTK